MKKAIFQLEDLACPSCMLKIEKAIKSVDGVDKDSVNVMFNASKAKVDFDENVTSSQAIQYAITKIGYEVLSIKEK